MNEQDLKIIIDEGEGYFVEFKESLNRIDREMVAFANSSGGRIFLGITDKSSIKGFHLSNKSKSEIQSIAENCHPPIRIVIERYDKIAIIYVPEGNRKPYKCSTGYYLRSGASSQKMNTDDIIDVIQSEGKIRFDEIFEKRFDVATDFDISKYKYYQRKCRISEDYPYRNVLQNLGVLTILGGKEMFNNTGILIFASQPTRYLIQAVITCVLYKGVEKLHILDRKDFSGDLISNIEESVLFLKKHLNIRYRIETLQREEILEVPETALREAIVNAAVHRDYFEKGANISIEIFDDRVEISNPGGLPKGLKLSEFGTRSVARNPLIASLMLRANYIEKLGTGIRRIQNSMSKAGLPEAKFEIGSFFTVKFPRLSETNSVAVVYSDANNEVLTENLDVNFGVFFGENFTEDFIEDFIENFIINFRVKFKLQGKQLFRIFKILELGYKNQINFNLLKNMNFKVSERTIRTDISKLKKLGFIEFKGVPKTGYYITTPKFREYLQNYKKNW